MGQQIGPCGFGLIACFVAVTETVKSVRALFVFDVAPFVVCIDGVHTWIVAAGLEPPGGGGVDGGVRCGCGGCVWLVFGDFGLLVVGVVGVVC